MTFLPKFCDSFLELYLLPRFLRVCLDRNVRKWSSASFCLNCNAFDAVFSAFMLSIFSNLSFTENWHTLVSFRLPMVPLLASVFGRACMIGVPFISKGGPINTFWMVRHGDTTVLSLLHFSEVSEVSSVTGSFIEVHWWLDVKGCIEVWKVPWFGAFSSELVRLSRAGDEISERAITSHRFKIIMRRLGRDLKRVFF